MSLLTIFIAVAGFCFEQIDVKGADANDSDVIATVLGKKISVKGVKDDKGGDKPTGIIFGALLDKFAKGQQDRAN